MEIFVAVLLLAGLVVLIHNAQHIKSVTPALRQMMTQQGNIGEHLMGKLDTLNAALESIDAATTELADQLAALAERVTADDISPAELQAAVDKAAALANKVSDASTSVAGIEAADVPLPDPVEDPNEEVPGDTTPDDGETPDDGTVVDPGVPAPGNDVPGDGQGGPISDGTGDSGGVIEGETTPVAEPGA